jgi:hypothetical protein
MITSGSSVPGGLITTRTIFDRLNIELSAYILKTKPLN